MDEETFALLFDSDADDFENFDVVIASLDDYYDNDVKYEYPDVDMYGTKEAVTSDTGKSYDSDVAPESSIVNDQGDDSDDDYDFNDYDPDDDYDE